jgi:hypothetical protein
LSCDDEDEDEDEDAMGLLFGSVPSSATSLQCEEARSGDCKVEVGCGVVALCVVDFNVPHGVALLLLACSAWSADCSATPSLLLLLPLLLICSASAGVAVEFSVGIDATDVSQWLAAGGRVGEVESEVGMGIAMAIAMEDTTTTLVDSGALSISANQMPHSPWWIRGSKCNSVLLQTTSGACCRVLAMWQRGGSNSHDEEVDGCGWGVAGKRWR